MERLQRSACWETGSQAAKLGFGTCAVIILILINSNVHQLVNCVTSQLIPAEAEAARSCVQMRVGHKIPLLLECCPSEPRLRLEAVDSVVLAYNRGNASSFIHWLTACAYVTTECPLRQPSRPTHCAFITILHDSYLCLNSSHSLQYAVFGGMRFDIGDSISIVRSIPTSC